jgi:hypothetical protein
MDGVLLSNDDLKNLLENCIEIIKLKKKSKKYTSFEENYITEDLSEDVKTEYKGMLNFLKNLHTISRNLSEKTHIRGYDYPDLIKDFRGNGITKDLVSDDKITEIAERWKELVRIKDKVSKINSVGGKYY